MAVDLASLSRAVTVDGMRRGAIYSLVGVAVAVALGLIVLIAVISTGPVDLGPKVVVPSEPTEESGEPSGDGGASPVPKPSPSSAGDDDDDDDDGGDDADDDADD